MTEEEHTSQMSSLLASLCTQAGEVGLVVVVVPVVLLVPIDPAVPVPTEGIEAAVPSVGDIVPCAVVVVPEGTSISEEVVRVLWEV